MVQVLFMGKEIFTQGTPPAVGALLPEASLCSPRLEDISLHHLGGPILLNIFPSIDTSVCAKSLKTFCSDCSSLTGLKLIHISHDLPFAMDRFLKENKLQAAVFSCFRSDFSEKMGLKITSGGLRGLCARCVILVDHNMRVQYVELVGELTQEPNYKAAIERAIDVC